MDQRETEGIHRVKCAKNKDTALNLIFSLVNDFEFCPLIHAFKMYLNYNIK